jgi:L,D-peptidoglycan transpeptidase YkuD (ErfK/YbiS/YcfS/YnhG family)
MTDLIVTADGTLTLGARTFRCALGHGGVRRDKREGDGATPAGAWPLRRVLYRPDRGPAPETGLETTPIAPVDGWCDAPDDPRYNMPVRLPYPASAEALWRDDALYDRIAVIGYNDAPPVAGRGSAIFLHVAKPDYAPTEGCVALAREDLAVVLARCRPGDRIVIETP